MGFKFHEAVQLLLGILSLKNEPKHCVSGWKANVVQKKRVFKEESIPASK